MLIGKCLSILLIVQALAVVMNVIIKRVHDDSYHKKKPPGKILRVAMHYLKYPFFLHHINYHNLAPKKHATESDRPQTKKSFTARPVNLPNGSLVGEE